MFIVFDNLLRNTLLTKVLSHSNLRFPAPSSKLPELVTHSLSLRSCPLILSECLGTNKTVKATVLEHALKYEVCPPQMKKDFHLSSNRFGFICDGVSNVDSYNRNAQYNLSCLLQSYCYLSTNKRPMVLWLFKKKIWNTMTAVVLKQDPNAFFSLIRTLIYYDTDSFF